MATVRDLIESALREIAVLAEGETATASQAWEGVQRLNRFIERLSLDRLTIYQVTRTTFSIVSGDGSYSIGATTGYKSPPQSGDVNVYRPVFINDVRYVDTSSDPDAEYSLRKLTDQAYANISMKALTSTLPQAWYYNPTYADGSLILWPAPTSSTLLGVLYIPTAMRGFGSGVPTVANSASILSTVVSVPDGYEEMLITNLAVLLCPTYERQPSPVLVKTAADALAAVKRANVRLQDLSFDAAVTHGAARGSYSIYEG